MREREHGTSGEGTDHNSKAKGEFTGSPVWERTKSMQYSLRDEEPGKRRMEYWLRGMGRMKTLGLPGTGFSYKRRRLASVHMVRIVRLTPVASRKLMRSTASTPSLRGSTPPASSTRSTNSASSQS